MTPHFALAFEGRNSRELRETGASVTILGAVRISRPLSVRRGRRALNTALDRVRPDVVVCHNPWALAVFGPTALTRGLPVVLWMHGAVTGRMLVERLARLVRPTLAVANSHFTATHIRNLYRDIRSAVVYSPADLSRPPRAPTRAEVRAALGADPGMTVIAQVSRIEPGKGHKVLLEALTTMKTDRTWECWIVGGAQRESDRRLLAELESLTRRAGLADRVRFLGERSDVATILGAVDIFCQPNLGAESFGLTFVEALAAGVPVVTSAIGGALEIVTPECGILVPPGSESALVEALGRLCADPAMRRELGENGRRRAKTLCDPATRLADMQSVLASAASVQAPAASGSMST